MKPPDALSRQLSDDEVARLLHARSRAMDEATRLFVARHTVTGLYGTRIQRFLHGCEGWRQATQPTIQSVQEQLAISAAHAPMWSADMQAAETWMQYDIYQFQHYLLDVEFVPVQLTLSSAA